MVQPDQFEAFYAMHPSVPKTIVRKIYEWNVSRDPDICPLYYDRSLVGIRTYQASDAATGWSSTSRTLTSILSEMGSSSVLPGIRKQEPIILTVRNSRQSRPI